MKARVYAISATAAITFGAICLACGCFARAALNLVSLPALRLMHRLTAPLPFPVLEPLMLILAALPLCSLISSIRRAVASRALRPLRRWLTSILWAALLLACALIVLWEPARAASEILSPPRAEADRLEALCASLIDALSTSDLQFPAPEEALRLAPQVAGLPALAVKAARYPEWMRAIGVSGLFMPLTGEAVVDAAAPAPLIPFTAVHELIHLTGVADEGEANLEAWRRCIAFGGAFADSARLWALRYATGLLRERDEAAWRRTKDDMAGATERLFRACGGEIAAADPSILSLGDYASLAARLCADAAKPSFCP